MGAGGVVWARGNDSYNHTLDPVGNGSYVGLSWPVLCSCSGSVTSPSPGQAPLLYLCFTSADARVTCPTVPDLPRDPRRRYNRSNGGLTLVKVIILKP